MCVVQAVNGAKAVTEEGATALEPRWVPAEGAPIGLGRRDGRQPAPPAIVEDGLGAACPSDRRHMGVDVSDHDLVGRTVGRDRLVDRLEGHDSGVILVGQPRLRVDVLHELGEESLLDGPCRGIGDHVRHGDVARKAPLIARRGPPGDGRQHRVDPPCLGLGDQMVHQGESLVLYERPIGCRELPVETVDPYEVETQARELVEIRLDLGPDVQVPRLQLLVLRVERRVDVHAEQGHLVARVLPAEHSVIA